MSLLSGTELFLAARKRQRAIPAFDVAGGNLDILHAICAELAKRQACAFLSSTPSSIQSYFSISHFMKTIADVSEEYGVCVAAHLDHASDLEAIDAALEAGCMSIMFDGSKLPFERNVDLTKRVVGKAHKVGASVEAELGIITGKENNIIADTVTFPTQVQAEAFVAATGIDFFAPAIGTVHGFYRGEPILQWELARDLGVSCVVPLVLHGASGLNDMVLNELIDLGFRKLNFATGVRAAFLAGIRDCLTGGNNMIKPQVYLKCGRESVSRFVDHILDLVMFE